MIKGLIITPPVLGRISIGKVSKRTVNVYLKKTINLPLPVRFTTKRVGSNILWMSSFVPRPPIRNSEVFLSGCYLMIQNSIYVLNTPYLTVRQDDPCVLVMVKLASVEQATGLNNILVHHLTYAHWHKVGSASPMPVYTSIWMNRMNSVALYYEPQALIVFVP
jgi:hypothetical protein